MNSFSILGFGLKLVILWVKFAFAIIQMNFYGMSNNCDAACFFLDIHSCNEDYVQLQVLYLLLCLYNMTDSIKLCTLSFEEAWCLIIKRSGVIEFLQQLNGATLTSRCFTPEYLYQILNVHKDIKEITVKALVLCQIYT